MIQHLFTSYNKQSKYLRWYACIINNAKNQTRSKKDGYFETHHILPRSMGGCNDADNLVLLTAKEHHICHHLLYLFTEGPDKHKMAFAWNMMCWATGRAGERPLYYNSRLYEQAKQAFAKSISIINSGDNLALRETLRNKPSANNTNYLFYNVNYKKHFFGTKYELFDHCSNLSYGEIDRILANPSLCSKGWMLQVGIDIPVSIGTAVGADHPAADNTVYTFVSSTNTYTCTRHELSDMFPDLNITTQGITDLIKGRQKSHRGFSLGILKNSLTTHAGSSQT